MSTIVKQVINEQAFDDLLSENLKSKSKRHFTSAEVAIKAAKWLVGKDKRKVLDIGAGVGKFCFFGAHSTGGQFVGIEMRLKLAEIANDIFKQFDIQKAKVLHGNITDFNFSDFNAFYFYNPFQENLSQHLRLDSSVLLAREFYFIYSQHTCLQLASAPKGTRLVTYHGCNFELPQSYTCIQTEENEALKFWLKED